MPGGLFSPRARFLLTDVFSYPNSHGFASQCIALPHDTELDVSKIMTDVSATDQSFHGQLYSHRCDTTTGFQA
jgi:hypothetical protein